MPQRSLRCPAHPLPACTHSAWATLQGIFRRLLNTLSPEERRKVDFNAGLAWQVRAGLVMNDSACVPFGLLTSVPGLC